MWETPPSAEKMWGGQENQQGQGYVITTSESQREQIQIYNQRDNIDWYINTSFSRTEKIFSILIWNIKLFDKKILALFKNYFTDLNF